MGKQSLALLFRLFRFVFGGLYWGSNLSQGLWSAATQLDPQFCVLALHQDAISLSAQLQEFKDFCCFPRSRTWKLTGVGFTKQVMRSMLPEEK